MVIGGVKSFTKEKPPNTGLLQIEDIFFGLITIM